MICTVRNLLARNNIGRRNTLYFPQSDSFFEYPMSMGDFFEYTSGLNKHHEFDISARIAQEVERGKDSEAYVAFMIQKRQLQQKMQDAKDRTELHEYRMEMKAVAEKLRLAEGEYTTQAIKSYHRKNGIAGHMVLVYKHHLLLNSLHNMRRILPELNTMDLDWLQDVPLFTENIYGLQGVHRDKMAIEGGPCLYGTDEVFTIVTMQDGTKHVFDCDSGVCKTSDGKLNQTSFFREQGEQIAEITFHCRKDGFSSQEIELLKALFGLAAAMQCRLLISLPDMSYKKYFFELTKTLPKLVQERAMQNYTEIVYQITDLYLAAMQQFQKQYSVPQFEVLHERNQAVLKVFETEREKYCSMGDVTTSFEDKRSSIYDYICLPAMPYYLWKVPHILEINSTDEADSVRKCMKHHKKVTRFHQIMLPEKVSSDGKTTVFRAQRVYKGYRNILEE